MYTHVTYPEVGHLRQIRYREVQWYTGNGIGFGHSLLKSGQKWAHGLSDYHQMLAVLNLRLK